MLGSVQGRNHALDTYKLLLSFMVFALHSRYIAPLGYLAVESFFILNGLMFFVRGGGQTVQTVGGGPVFGTSSGNCTLPFLL